MACPIQARRRALSEIARCLKIHKDLQDGESSSGLHVTRDIPAGRLAKLGQDRLDRWFVAFGPELRIRAKCWEEKDLEWSASVEDHHQASLGTFLDSCLQYGDPAITLFVDIVKPDPLPFSLGLAGAGPVHSVLFFYGRKLRQILSGIAERSFESDFLRPSEGPVTDRRLLILVADRPGLLSGPYLAILGRDRHDAIAEILGPEPPFDRLRAARERTRATSPRENAPRMLAPEFFEMSHVAGRIGCRPALDRLQNRLVVASIANRTFQDENRKGASVSVFAGEQVVEVPLGDSGGTETPHPLRLYRWIHQEEQTARTRLEVVRRVTASHLLPKSEENFDRFLARSEQILADSVVQMDVLIDGNIIASFERQEKLEEIVSKYVQDVGNRVTDLGKEVVDNTYKTVGLLAGVAIAYLLKPAGGIALLAIAMVLYETYVAFVRYFYIRSIKEDFRSEKAAFRERWSSMSELRKFFDPKVTGRLEDKIKERNGGFDRRYGFINRLYNVLLAAGLAVLLLLAIHELRGLGGLQVSAR